MWVGLSLGRSTPRIRGMVCCAPSALALFVARVRANDQQFPVTADQLAVFADPLHARSNLHVRQTPSRCDARSVWKRLFIAGQRRPGKRARDSLTTSPLAGGVRTLNRKRRRSARLGMTSAEDPDSRPRYERL